MGVYRMFGQGEQESLAKAAWDKEAKNWTSRNQKMWDQGSRKKILPFFEKRVEKGACVLDIGCSGGYSTYRLNQLGYEAAGMDISEEMIHIATLSYPEIAFTNGNISSISVEDESYDAVLCVNVLEFTEKPHQAVGEIYRILKQGGRACVGVLGPTAAPRQNAFRRLYGESVMMNTMQAWEFESIAETHGLKIIAGCPVEKNWQIDLTSLPRQAQQALSFMYVFMLEK